MKVAEPIDIEYFINNVSSYTFTSKINELVSMGKIDKTR